MRRSYEAPRVLSLPLALTTAENHWAVAAAVAAIVGVPVAIVLSVCSSCGTLQSVTDCYNTMVTWISGGYC